MSINFGSQDNLQCDLFVLFLARSLSSVYRRYNKYLFSRASLFSLSFSIHFFSTDSLAPTIRTFSPAFPSPLPLLRIQSPCLFISRSELFVNATRMIYVSPWRFVYQIIQLIGKRWRPLFFAKPCISREINIFIANTFNPQIVLQCIN